METCSRYLQFIYNRAESQPRSGVGGVIGSDLLAAEDATASSEEDVIADEDEAGDDEDDDDGDGSGRGLVDSNSDGTSGKLHSPRLGKMIHFGEK